MKKNFMNIKSKLQENGIEHALESLNDVSEQFPNNNEFSEVKDIFKISIPLTLEPSLYSPIHPTTRLIVGV